MSWTPSQCIEMALSNIGIISNVFSIIGIIGIITFIMQFQYPPSQAQNNLSGKRIKFTPAEDQLLSSLVPQFGLKSWAVIARLLPGRTPRQCRDRWNHYLSPKINISSWTPEEDQLLIQKVHELGNKWSKIAQFFPGRNGISIRNHCCKLSRQPHADGYLKQILANSKENVILYSDEQSDNSPVSPEIETNIVRLPSCLSLLQKLSLPFNEVESGLFPIPISISQLN